jgi:hypothetical protein
MDITILCGKKYTDSHTPEHQRNSPYNLEHTFSSVMVLMVDKIRQ